MRRPVMTDRLRVTVVGKGISVTNLQVLEGVQTIWRRAAGATERPMWTTEFLIEAPDSREIVFYRVT